MKKILFVGHTGRLGRAFIEQYSDQFEIIGMSRTAANPKIREISANILFCNWDKMLEEAGELDGVVFAPFMRPWNPGKIADVSDGFIFSELGVHVSALIQMMRALKKAWADPAGKTVVVVSSVSALEPQAEEQFVYCAAKAAQLSIVENAKLHFAPAKIIALTPTRFPSPSLSCEDVARQVAEQL